jgi:hypothetical protein
MVMNRRNERRRKEVETGRFSKEFARAFRGLEVLDYDRFAGDPNRRATETRSRSKNGRRPWRGGAS